MARTPCFTAEGLGSIPGRGSKIPQAAQPGQNKKIKSKIHCLLASSVATEKSAILIASSLHDLLTFVSGSS